MTLRKTATKKPPVSPWWGSRRMHRCRGNPPDCGSGNMLGEKLAARPACGRHKTVSVFLEFNMRRYRGKDGVYRPLLSGWLLNITGTGNVTKEEIWLFRLASSFHPASKHNASVDL